MNRSTSSRRPADWELPAGVNRGLWDYLHDPEVARGYDAGLAGSGLFAVDRAFVERHCPREGPLLDLGCGTGRLLLALAARGTRVLGVDLSAEMLAVAGEKAAAANLPVELVQANITDLRCFADGAFSCVACLFSTLGMVMGVKNRERVAAEACRVLRPGGRFVLHVHNRWFNIWNGPGRAWLLRDVWRGWSGDRAMPVHQGIAGLTLHLFTRREAERLLESVGFRVVEISSVGLRADGKLRAPWCCGGLRAYGYLLAAEKR